MSTDVNSSGKAEPSDILVFFLYDIHKWRSLAHPLWC